MGDELKKGEPVNCTSSELCTFLQVLAEGFTPTCSSDINASAPSKSMSIASKSYRKGRKTVSFHGFPSLQMSANLTVNHGVDLSMSSAEASPAKMSASATLMEQVSTENALASGERWSGSFAKWDRELSSLKTQQTSLTGDSEEYSGTWPRWGSMRNGECWERSTLEPPHHRERIWILAYASGFRLERPVHDGDGSASDVPLWGPPAGTPVPPGGESASAASRVLGVHDGLAHRSHVFAADDWKQRIQAAGNGQVPQCAALAWRTLAGRIGR